MWAVVAFLSLVTVGCIEVDITLSVQDDGLIKAETLTTGEPELEGLDTSAFDELFPGGAQGFCDRGVTEPLGVVPSDDARFGARLVDVFADGDSCGVRSKVFFDPSIGPGGDAEFLDMIFGGSFSDGVIRETDENWQFDAALDVAAVSGTSSDWFGDPDQQSTIQFEELADLDITIRVDLPGQAIEGRHNATSVDGGSFTWVIDYDNPPARLFAATAPATGRDLGLSLVVIPTAVTLIAVGLGGVAWQFRRSRGPAQKSSGPAAQPAAVPAREPVFDHDSQIWVGHDPVRGKVWYHEQSGKWVPF